MGPITVEDITFESKQKVTRRMVRLAGGEIPADLRPLRMRLQSEPRRQKVAVILKLAGVACISLGLAWTLCYVFFGRYELSVVFIGLTGVGMLALHRSRRSDSSSLLLVAHGVFAVVCAIAVIDAPMAWVPRSAHLFLLPLAAGAAFTFERRERYGALIFPLLCIAAFAAFAMGALDPLAPNVSPPLEVRAWGAKLNTTTSMLLLATLFAINRIDSGKRLRLERELSRAVRNGEIEVYYQPQVRDHDIVSGAEALVRWRHPSGRLLSPDAFIDLAEESNLICEIGLEVLRQACETLSHWSADPRTQALRIAVNISPVQMQDPSLVHSVSTIIREAGIEPSLLEFELTESALATDTATVIERMEALASSGTSWALDDFGTGYSSLATLRTLPVGKLKIDRQFLIEATRQESAQQLLGKIIEISHVMGMCALAEGVETPDQRELLIQLGCDHFQGYLFARPMSRKELDVWLDTSAAPSKPRL
ncbi:EAL domain-containing protein [Rhizobium sp. P38BS-XIX]|uniref:putative bifunctional diguanylate cyclase/phosphodiesterase n=1 Tax=Rhizobium sp. P38BS-XIX TaxID=2726740 RepID=UPI001FED9E76|nr:EAL domain-containing protein [Rhizobium sp. P38BS-XIX]